MRDILSAEPRCIYCSAAPASIEHMPPIWFFQKRQRPKGHEFAACENCNVGTKAADLVTGWLARIRPFHGQDSDPLYPEAVAKIGNIDDVAPGLREEIFDNSPFQEQRLLHNGEFHDVVRIEAKGPLLSNYLVTFGAKLGMALYREHVGEALPMTGSVFVQPILNAGLTREAADHLLNILPNTATLRQGKIEASSQFAYAYNSDRRSIILSLVSFHENLHFRILATADPDTYRATIRDRFVAEVAPGQLHSTRSLESFDPPAIVQENARKAMNLKRPILPGLPRPAGWVGPQ